MWICEHCGADVEEGWEVCWSCTRPREPAGEKSRLAGPAGRSAGAACPRCRSTSIIPGVELSTPQGGARAHLPEHPGALLFKGGAESPIVAEICAECGHIMLRATEHALLWRLYQQMRQ